LPDDPTQHLREYFALLFKERHRLYMSMFHESKVAVDKALTAQKEMTSVIFAASEKAVTKAEDAQREYNIRSNEFRGQLDDQAKKLMPREEARVLISNLDSKIEALKKEIDSLRESRSELGGKEFAGIAQHQQRNVTTALVTSLGLGVLAILVSVILFAIGFARH
jgi:hypothetical protein